MFFSRFPALDNPLAPWPARKMPRPAKVTPANVDEVQALDEVEELRAKLVEQGSGLAALADALRAQHEMLADVSRQLADQTRLAAQRPPASAHAPASLVDQLQMYQAIQTLMRENAPPSTVVVPQVTPVQLAAAFGALLDKVPGILDKWGEAKATMIAASRLRPEPAATPAEAETAEEGEE